jgi:hypothetical protein
LNSIHYYRLVISLLGNYKSKTSLRTGKFLVCFAVLAISLSSVVDCSEMNGFQFERTYMPYSGYCIVETSDGGYAIAGQQGSLPQSSFHNFSLSASLMKLNASGFLEWSRTYDNSAGGGFIALSVLKTSDIGFVLIGLQNSYGSALVFILKTDAMGNVQWNKLIAWPDNTYLCTGIQTSDQGYLLAGTSMNKNEPNSYGWLLKTDIYGNQMWNKTFTAPRFEPQSYVDAKFVIEDSGNYLLAGNWGNNPWLTQIDVNGNVNWNQIYNLCSANTPSQYSVFSLTPAVDSGYLLAGGNWHISFLIKTNQQGTMEWNHTSVKDSNFASVITSTDKQGYIAVGGSTYPTNPAALIAQFDSKGKLVSLWNSSATTQNSNCTESFAHSITSTIDGGYAVTGALNSTVWMAKISSQTTLNLGYVDSTNSTIMIVTILIVAVGSVVFASRKIRKSHVNKSES